MTDPYLPVPYSGAPVYQPEPVLAQFGEIQVTPRVARTPAGEIPLRGSVWSITDQFMATQHTPTWAIVCAILGFFCLTIFSLLFLLAKETRFSGYVNVMVGNGRQMYTTRIPVMSQAQVAHIYNQVNYVRSVSLTA
ncbi:hypothetical protein Lfu02_53930 [Longispora fulva]|uniref:Uncharacterized protein n=1 Tax=Longispora fulva TaxID=619741 RepID=A0A8J7KJS1_9ACTN|nr:hypothetical protein [Longispora fulva]MBG6140715.1 hypothetical protein [Longispora fulva]GIG61021.1 hypothetical protein Lfu02_53930 [Longispora fulva]